MGENSSESLFLALDQGGHSSRAVVTDSCGNIVAKAQESVATSRPGPYQVEQNPSELVDSLKNCCAGISKQLGHRVSRIQSAALATQRSSILCWERDSGRALSPVLSWQDRRAGSFVDSMEPQAELIKKTTGLVLSPHYGASKLRWCLQELPAVKNAEQSDNLVLGPLASYLSREITNSKENFCDPANASRTQLWDIQTRDWSEKLCRRFEVNSNLLPRSVPSRHCYGDILIGDYKIPLKVLTGDQSAAIYAFGEPSQETVYINMGTGAFIQWPIGRELQIVPGLLNSVVYQDGQHADHVLEGTINGAGSALTWFAKGRDGDPKQLVAEGVTEAEIEAPPIFINGISGLGSPFWVSELESKFSHEASDGLKTVAILESIAFLICANLECMKGVGHPIKKIIVSGGLASIDYLCQAITELAELEVQRTEVKEATARGLVYLLAQPDAYINDLERRQFKSEESTALSVRHQQWKKEMARIVEDQNQA